MQKYVCEVCGWEYDPEVGVPEAGIAPLPLHSRDPPLPLNLPSLRRPKPPVSCSKKKTLQTALNRVSVVVCCFEKKKTGKLFPPLKQIV